MKAGDVAVIAGLVILLVLVWGGLYLRSLDLHPDTRCRACQGTGRHSDSHFFWGIGDCQACGGTGRQPRAGRRLL
jgi:hypothetical protein